MKRLTPSEVASYRRDGYITVSGIIDEPMLEELREVTDLMAEKAAAVGHSDTVFDFATGPGPPVLRRIKSPEQQDPAYARAQAAEAVLDCLEDILGGPIRFWAGKLNLKQPHGGQAVEWHQDWAFGPATNDNLLTVGLALDDATVENGCLMVIPGSHHGPVLDHWKDGRFMGAVSEPTLDLSNAQALEIRSGGISVHHTRTLHGSAPNRSTKPRRLLLFTYAAADAWPLSGVADLGAFNAQMLRGTPPAAPRLDRVPVAPWPQWDTEPLGRDTSIFDFQDRMGESQFN
ncbi:MAG TPA: phytanoyl-CoA dioxygenase family protein [Acidimicrobiales bacterium]|nr:phytanoyl-CoA dioxygenase family protein [Acidimicrobiales bacterium]